MKDKLLQLLRTSVGVEDGMTVAQLQLGLAVSGTVALIRDIQPALTQLLSDRLIVRTPRTADGQARWKVA